jgi:hypothetical protein
MPVISVLRRLKQEDLEFKASLDYIVRLPKSNQKKGKKKRKDF